MLSLREEIAALKGTCRHDGEIGDACNGDQMIDDVLKLIDKHEALVKSIPPLGTHPTSLPYIRRDDVLAIIGPRKAKPREARPGEIDAYMAQAHAEALERESHTKPEASYVTGVTGGTLVKKSIFKQQCEAARGSEGWQEAERELAEHKAREERPAREKLWHLNDENGVLLYGFSAIVEAIDALGERLGK